MRFRVSLELEEDIKSPLKAVVHFPVKTRLAASSAAFKKDAPHSTRDLSPQHSSPCHQQNRAQDSPQPQHRNPRAQMRAEHTAGDRTDQQGTDQMRIDAARPNRSDAHQESTD